MKKFQHGFIVGKFMPLHNGHIFLLDNAVEQCKQVTVCLISQGDDPISGEVRLRWLRELYDDNTCTVVNHTAELPRDETGYENWNVWLDSIKQHCPQDYDAVFSSEEYGERLAGDLGAIHILVDQARTSVPVSGTIIRQNPLEHFQYLPAIVQQYYENQN